MSSGSAQPAPTAKERSPLLEMLFIAAPVVATMTSYTAMQFVDKLMVSRISGDPIWVGAQGNGGIVAFVPIAIAMGFITVVNTFVSQNLGADKPERAPAYAWAGIWISIFYWLLVMIPFGILLPQALALGHDSRLSADELARVIQRDQLAAGYGRILIFGAVITMAARGIAQYFYGMHKPMIVLIASVTGNIVNFVLNSLLVYGPQAPVKNSWGFLSPVLDSWFEFTASIAARLGTPRLELAGSAISTVIGTTVELAIPLAVFLSPKFNRLYGTVRSWRPSLSHMKDLWRIGWPPALMFGNEMVCWGFFMVYLVGDFGAAHSTAGYIAHQWMSLSFMPTVGISVAMTAMVGKCIGMKRLDLAVQRAWLGLGVAVTYMTFCGLCFVLFRRHLVAAFIDSTTPPDQAARIIQLGAQFLIATAAFQFFDGVAMSLTGALKGAGDTRFPSIMTVLLSWTIIVAGGLAMVRWAPQLQSLGPWIAAAVYIALLSMAMFWRFRSGEWKKIKLLDDRLAEPIPAAA